MFTYVCTHTHTHIHIYFHIYIYPSNAQKLKKAQGELTHGSQKEQKEYIQSHINKIRKSVEDRQS